MNVIHLTPGTGSFYCGSCMRDNALNAALRGMGHDALVVPLYLPFLVDEMDESTGTPLFFGGINVYLQHKSALFRKTPRWVDSLLDSPGLLQAAGRKAGMTSARELGELTLSMLQGEDGRQVKELNRLVDWLVEQAKPDVICLSNALLIGMARRLKERVKAPVVSTLQGEDSFLDSLPDPYRDQCWDTLRQRAADVDGFVAVSNYYGNVMRERLQLPPERVHVVYNGILLEEYSPAPSPPDPPVLGYLARMCPMKGLETLVDSFILLRTGKRIEGLKLRVGGTQTGPDIAFVSRLRERLRSAGLESDAEFLPNLDQKGKAAFLRSLSVLSVPATYGESFGLYIIEALACGVPVVQPRHAAFPELIEATGGGLLCEPDNPESLADSIAQLLANPDEARAMGERGRKVVLKDFSVERMAENVLKIYEAVSCPVSSN